MKTIYKYAGSSYSLSLLQVGLGKSSTRLEHRRQHLSLAHWGSGEALCGSKIAMFVVSMKTTFKLAFASFCRKTIESKAAKTSTQCQEGDLS